VTDYTPPSGRYI